MTKIFVTDIDGTLVGAGGEVHPRDALAIRELLRRKIPVALCTGRMFSGTREVGRKLALVGPAACIDGSHIVDLHSGAALSCTGIEGDVASALCAALTRVGPATFVFAGDRVIHDRRGERYLDYVSTWSNEQRRVKDALHHSVWTPDAGIAALVVLANEAHVGEIQLALERIAGLQHIVFEVRRQDYSGTWGMVIRASGVDKGTAVDWLAAHYGVGVEDVVAVGDWLNDVPMLKRAGRSFAMAQAPLEVKAAARELLEADIWTGGGVAEAAERAGLI